MRLFLLLIMALLISPMVVAANAAPNLTVAAPTDGATITDTTVTVRFQVSDFTLVQSSVPLDQAGKQPEANQPGEGHLHLMLDLSPVVVWDRNDPYTFTNVPAGEHRLMVELVNNDHSSLSPPVMRQIQFRVAPSMPSTGTGGEGALVSPASGGVLLALATLAALTGGLLRRRRMAAGRK